VPAHAPVSVGNANTGSVGGNAFTQTLGATRATGAPAETSAPQLPTPAPSADTEHIETVPTAQVIQGRRSGESIRPSMQCADQRAGALVLKRQEFLGSVSLDLVRVPTGVSSLCKPGVVEH
jgi:hypothetical protein